MSSWIRSLISAVWGIKPAAPRPTSIIATRADAMSSNTGADGTEQNDQWKDSLTPEQYDVCRLKGTEMAFTGKYYDHHETGTYACVCCGSLLFSSKTKYDSGTGWPSFYDTSDGKGHCSPDARVTSAPDESHQMMEVVVEITCSKCDSHLGHVFEDGPRPTGLRYCVNSASLSFVPETKDNEHM